MSAFAWIAVIDDAIGEQKSGGEKKHTHTAPLFVCQQSKKVSRVEKAKVTKKKTIFIQRAYHYHVVCFMPLFLVWDFLSQKNTRSAPEAGLPHTGHK